MAETRVKNARKAYKKYDADASSLFFIYIFIQEGSSN